MNDYSTKDPSSDNDFSRRGFLKTLGLAGVALAIEPAFNKAQAATAIAEGRRSQNSGGSLPHRTLGTGNAALEVSALGFGVMGMTYNRSQHPDKKQCVRLLREAVERGVTLFDTAIIYGPLTNENLAGEALSEFKGRINVTTKFGHEVINGKGTGRLDSSRELGIGFVPYSPINRGFLGGCVNEYTVFDPTNDNRQTLPRFQPEAMRANTRIVNVLQQFGRTRGMTSAQVALGWLLQKAPWIAPIPGTTKLSHLEENLRSLDFRLSAEEWSELETAVAAIPVVGSRYNAEQQRQVEN